MASCLEQGRAGSLCFCRRYSSYIKPEARNSGQRGVNTASLQYTCRETHVCENVQRHTETIPWKTQVPKTIDGDTGENARCLVWQNCAV